MKKEKPKVLASQFLDWFLSDKEDIIVIGTAVKQNLIEHGKYSVSIKNLFKDCGYIPGDLVYNGDTSKEYTPSGCRLVNDLKPKTYYRVFDTQRGVYFATGYNAESMKDLLYQFKHYIAGGMDRPSNMSWCTSWNRVADWLQGAVLEKSKTPFDENEIL